GGYHWNHIANQPFLILVFMICAVMLPAVSLHFYQMFPRRKPWLERYPRLVLCLIYVVPAAFLAALIVLYFQLRGLVQSQHDPDLISQTLKLIPVLAYGYLMVASLWYLCCVACLIHSFRAARDDLERNQVKWILLGAAMALVPIGYSFYLAIWDP